MLIAFELSKRSSHLKAIRVTVQNGNKVVLEGKVDNLDERRAVENAAWSAAGVASVEDRLTIG
jgi:osmotically-inducible protein OsmY